MKIPFERKVIQAMVYVDGNDALDVLISVISEGSNPSLTVSL